MSFVNFEAYFLGPKAENQEFYYKLLTDCFYDHVQWRKAFHHEDMEDFITEEDKMLPNFKKSQEKIKNTLYTLKEMLKNNQPFFSPRYIGHMNWETMMAPTIAYFCAALYNSNNVAFEGSTGTSKLELEVGRDFCRMFGFDPDKGWGHICTGGTIANMEGIWIARNMKLIPLVLKRLVNIKQAEIDPDSLDNDQLTLIKELRDSSDEDLISKYNPVEILDYKEIVMEILHNSFDKTEADELFDKNCLQETGLKGINDDIDLGVVFLPDTKHYSLKKAMDLLGLGRCNAVFIPVDKYYRMDMDVLEKRVMEETRPIIAVVGVTGTTEESAVDAIDKIVEIRKRLKSEKGKGFHIHVDAAYGGYVRTLFLNGKSQFMDFDRIKLRLRELGIINDKPERTVNWPSSHVVNAYRAFADVDTITVDPHKLGYVIYPAGGIAMRDKRMREAIHTFAPYVFERPKAGDPDNLIGSYILEGSKPGAAAAAVWTAHKIMPLNITGYGKLIGETIDGAQTLYDKLLAWEFRLDENTHIQSYTVTRPDINIVNYAFNFHGNTSLKVMNKLTTFIAENIFGCIGLNQCILEKTFIVSSTKFSFEEYKGSPISFLRTVDIPESEWWDREEKKNIGEVKIIRSVIMSPYLTTDYVKTNYVSTFIKTLEEELRKHKTEICAIKSAKK